MSAPLVAGRYPHGHYLAYAKGRCRCQECQVAYRRRRKADQVRRATSGPSLVGAAPAREHVQGLLEAGVSLAQVAAAAPEPAVARALGPVAVEVEHLLDRFGPASVQRRLLVTKGLADAEEVGR